MESTRGGRRRTGGSTWHAPRRVLEQSAVPGWPLFRRLTPPGQARCKARGPRRPETDPTPRPPPLTLLLDLQTPRRTVHRTHHRSTMFHDDHQHFAGLTWASNSRAKRPNGSRVAPRSTTLQGLAIGTVYLVYLTMSIFYLGCASAATPAPSFAPIPAPTAVPSLAPTNWTVPPTHSTAAPTPAPLPVPTLAPSSSSSTTNTTAEMTNTTSTTSLCNIKCSAYYAGASASDPLVCKYKASGVATVQESREEGVTCFPAYNCGSDWTVCVNNEEAMDVRKVGAGPRAR